MVAADHAQVHEVHPLDLQGAQVVLDALAQVGRLIPDQPGAVGIAARTDLGDELEVVRVRVQRFPDQLVDGVRAVVLRGVDRPEADAPDGLVAHPCGVVRHAPARVLDLDGAERRHLFHLAEAPLPPRADPYPDVAPEELARVVEGLLPNPAYLLGPRADVLAWNAAASRFLGTPSRAPDGRQNALWWLFTDDGAHPPTWHDTGRNMLARFRAEHARRYDDPRFLELIEALLDASPRFRELWRRHEVLEHQLGTKVVDHPVLGRLEVLHLQSIPTSHPDLRLVQFVPVDDATRDAFAR